jgi:hypothetical protein
VEATIEKTNEISSALRCRLSEAKQPKSVGPDAQHGHLILQGIAQNAEVGVRAVTRRGLFRRSR